MIKHETIAVSGTVLYCDDCGKRGPEEAYDNASDCIEQAQQDGWIQDDKGKDMCPACKLKPAAARAGKKRARA